MFIALVMPSSILIQWCPLLLEEGEGELPYEPAILPLIYIQNNLKQDLEEIFKHHICYSILHKREEMEVTWILNVKFDIIQP